MFVYRQNKSEKDQLTDLLTEHGHQMAEEKSEREKENLLKQQEQEMNDLIVKLLMTSNPSSFWNTILEFIPELMPNILKSGTKASCCIS